MSYCFVHDKGFQWKSSTTISFWKTEFLFLIVSVEVLSPRSSMMGRGKYLVPCFWSLKTLFYKILFRNFKFFFFFPHEKSSNTLQDLMFVVLLKQEGFEIGLVRIRRMTSERRYHFLVAPWWSFLNLCVFSESFTNTMFIPVLSLEKYVKFDFSVGQVSNLSTSSLLTD